MRSLIFLFAASLFLSSCSRSDTEVNDDNEGITTVQLSFTPQSGSSKVLDYYWRDGKGDVIQLEKNVDYSLSVSYLNESGLQTQDLTTEIEDESDAHLIILKSTPEDLFSISAIDKDSKGRKLGLKNKVKAKNNAAGGNLRVILKHQPPINGRETKDGMDENIGSTDSDVSFPVSIK